MWPGLKLTPSLAPSVRASSKRIKVAIIYIVGSVAMTSVGYV